MCLHGIVKILGVPNSCAMQKNVLTSKRKLGYSHFAALRHMP
jgi:hypothetical protein